MTRCGAVALFARTADGWERKQTLRGAVPSDFGAALAITDNLLVVGAPSEWMQDEDDIEIGAVYLYSLIGDRWELTHKIVGDDPLGTSLFGASLFVESEEGVLAVGALATPYLPDEYGDRGGGAVYLFDLRGSPVSGKIAPSFLGWGAGFGKGIWLNQKHLVVLSASNTTSFGNDDGGAFAVYALEDVLLEGGRE